MGSGVHADASPRSDDLVFEGVRLVSLGATVHSFFFFIALDTGPERHLDLELSGTKVCDP